jgi:hypothetical protein
MTFWRGMFRVWIFATALWAIFVVIVSWSGMVSPSLPRKAFYLKDAQSTPYQLAESYPSYSWVSAQREVSLPNSVTLYASRDIPEQAVAAATESVMHQASDPRAGEAWTARLQALLYMMLTIGGVSGVLLALGLAVRWVVQGFGFHAKAKPPQ